jgi:hypothetical protein
MIHFLVQYGFRSGAMFFVVPGAGLMILLDEVSRDRTHIFWG